jgi:hypothetical protein
MSFNFNYVQHNITSSSQVKRKPLESGESITFFLENNMKGDLYEITKAITWFMAVVRAKVLSRTAIAKFANCHIDTVSSVNMRLEASGLFKIFRTFKKPNHYRTAFLSELCKIFGYCQQSSASLFTLNKIKNINLYHQEAERVSNLGYNPNISEKAYEKLLDILEKIEVRPPVFRLMVENC